MHLPAWEPRSCTSPEGTLSLGPRDGGGREPAAEGGDGVTRLLIKQLLKERERKEAQGRGRF